MSTLRIDYYTDILCVWAWIAQRRLEELEQHFGKQIDVHYHYIDLFGDTHHKMQTQWQDRDGFNGFAEHVVKASAPYKDAAVNDNIWSKVRPTTSANAHLILKAVQLSEGNQASAQFALQLRQAFFCDAQDISNMPLLMSLAKDSGFDLISLQEKIHSGEAIAALMQDYQLAKTHSIKGSPSYVMNHARQTLYGNVGYRVLQANIEELLRQPCDEASWC